MELFRLPDEDQDPYCDKCEDDRKDKRVLGMEIVRDMEFDEEWEWEDGTICDPKKGSVYDCEMWFEDGDYDTLKVEATSCSCSAPRVVPRQGMTSRPRRIKRLFQFGSGAFSFRWSPREGSQTSNNRPTRGLRQSHLEAGRVPVGRADSRSSR